MIKQETLIGDWEALISQLHVRGFSGELTNAWREAHREELENWFRQHADYVPKKTTQITFKEIGQLERTPAARSARNWLVEQLSEVQNNVYLALREWKGTLLPSEDLSSFLEKWPIEHLEDAHDQVLRILDQLAGLGLIACVSVPNRFGDYISGYRVLREEELTRQSDLEGLGAPA